MALNLAKKGIDVILTYQHKKEDALEVVNEIRGDVDNGPPPCS